jgi:signal recognition particle subunit SRP19
MRQKNKIVIWPVYFDSTKTIREGRKVPKNLAIPDPKIFEIKEVVEKLSLDYSLISDANYPKTPWLKTGMLIITKKEKKVQLLTDIARQLMKKRGKKVERN